MMGSEIGTHAHAGHGLSHMVIQFPERGFVLKRYDFCFKVLFSPLLILRLLLFGLGGGGGRGRANLYSSAVSGETCAFGSC